jgi:hypothetical protein
MKSGDGHDERRAGRRLDLRDLTLLDEIARLYEAVDPMPPDLAERVKFALELEQYDGEVLHAREEPLVGARGAAPESRTVTFDSESLTVMIDIGVPAGDMVRLDGWLAPPGDHVVELRTSQGSLSTRADEGGRFVFDAVPRGLAQLVVRPPGEGGTAQPLAVTPSIVL